MSCFSGCGLCVFKCFTIFANVLGLVIGLALALPWARNYGIDEAAGAWGVLGDNLTRSFFRHFALTCVVVGIITAVVCFIGIVSACLKYRWLIITYVICLVAGLIYTIWVLIAIHTNMQHIPGLGWVRDFFMKAVELLWQTEEGRYDLEDTFEGCYSHGSAKGCVDWIMKGHTSWVFTIVAISLVAWILILLVTSVMQILLINHRQKAANRRVKSSSSIKSFDGYTR